MAAAKVAISPTITRTCDTVAAHAFSAVQIQQYRLSQLATEVINSVQQQMQEANMYNQLFKATYDSKKKSSSSSLIVEFLKQLKWGSNIMNSSVPSNLLSGLSLLETTARTNAPTSNLLFASSQQTAEGRFMYILKYFLNSLHYHFVNDGYMRSKPFNPILGEQFHCKWVHHEQQSETVFHAEQVSHHPPITAMHMENKKAGFEMSCTIGVNVSIGLNKCTSVTSGLNYIKLPQWNETYRFTRPNTVVSQLLLGTGYIRPANYMTIVCEETGYSANLYVNDTYISGKITCHGRTVYTIPSSANYLQEVHMTNAVTGKTELLWSNSMHTEELQESILVEPISKQKANESRRVWHSVSQELHADNFSAATEAKLRIEEDARTARKTSIIKPTLFNALNGNKVDDVQTFYFVEM